MKIIHRYVLREHVGPFVFALAALTSLLLLNYVAKQFGQLVGKGLSAGVIGKFLGLSVPFTVAMTMPMSVLVATLYAFSRLAAENEITALKANGVSAVRLLVPALLAACLLSVSMVAFNDIVLPAANHELRTLQGDIARKKPTFGLREQIINEVSPGRLYLRAAYLTADNRMREVTIFDLGDPMRRRSIYADSGEMAFAPNGSDLLLTLHNGFMLEVPRAEQGRLQRLDFATDYVRVEGVANQLEVTRQDSYKSDREMTVCELQNEVSRYEQEFDRSHADLRRVLQEVTREALTGVPAQAVELGPSTYMTAMPGAPAPRSSHASLGRAYCDAKAALRRYRARASAALGASALHAAPATWGRQDQGTSAADSARRQAERAAAVAIDPAVQAVVPPVALQGQEPGTAGVSPQEDSSIATPVPSRTFAMAPTPATVLTGQLQTAQSRMIDARHAVNRNAVELHKKFAISVACTVFVLVGAPIALRFPRGGVGLTIGVSLAVFALYYVGLIAGESLADRDLLTPFQAMWAANILLTGIGVVLLVRVGQEGATSRGGDFAEMVEVVRNTFTRGYRKVHHEPRIAGKLAQPGPTPAAPEGPPPADGTGAS